VHEVARWIGGRPIEDRDEAVELIVIKRSSEGRP
jgi:hypothetical protein